jgi:hypothetical protein
MAWGVKTGKLGFSSAAQPMPTPSPSSLLSSASGVDEGGVSSPAVLDIDLDTLGQRRVWVLPDPVPASPSPTPAAEEPRDSRAFFDSTPDWLDSVPVPAKSDDAQLSRLRSSPLVQQVIERFLDEDRKATQRVLAASPVADHDSQWPDQERRRAVLPLAQSAHQDVEENLAKIPIQRNTKNSL